MSPTNSEAEPAGEVIEEAEEVVVRENGGGGEMQQEQEQQEVSPPASVQSSEEAGARVEGKLGGRNEPAGAADSSDQAQVVATMEEAGEKDTSPDQSGTS